MIHTKEPWIAIKDGNPELRNEAWHIEGRDGDLVTYGHMSEQDARRIVACVNALAVVPTDWLEKYTAGNVENVLQENARIRRQRDELLAVLKYYRNECSGNEPSISVFNRMVDEALAKAESAA